MALAVRGWGFEASLTISRFGVLRLANRQLPSTDRRARRPGRRRRRHRMLWRSPSLQAPAGSAKLRAQSTRRWFNRVLVACEVISRHGGQIPEGRARTEAIPAGERLHLPRRRPASAPNLHDRRKPPRRWLPPSAPREVRVLRDARQRLVGPVLHHLARRPLGSRSPVAGADGVAVGSHLARHRRRRQPRPHRIARAQSPLGRRARSRQIGRALPPDRRRCPRSCGPA